MIGLALGTVGAALAASPGGRRVARGALAASAAAVLFAVQFVLYGKIDTAGPFLTAAVVGIAALVPLSFLAVRTGSLELPHAARRLALAAGVLDAAAMVVFAAAQSRGPSSVASVTVIFGSRSSALRLAATERTVAEVTAPLPRSLKVQL